MGYPGTHTRVPTCAPLLCAGPRWYMVLQGMLLPFELSRNNQPGGYLPAGVLWSLSVLGADTEHTQP